MQVKQAVVGYGMAEKKQVIAMGAFFLHLGEELKLDDTADALAIAICHAHNGLAEDCGSFTIRNKKGVNAGKGNNDVLLS